MKIAILVDGGFYRKVAQRQIGKVTPEVRASELFSYCRKHYDGYEREFDKADLYRIFYYDCPPIGKQVYHPLLKRAVDFKKTDSYKWMNDFLEELKKKRKVALRLGNLQEEFARYSLKPEILKKILNSSRNLESLTEDDFIFEVNQKGVDMKIGVDIASLSYKKQVDKIVLIAGDSDFVPAAKLARREGIDFVLDPLYMNIKPDLFEHIDGLITKDKKFKSNDESNAPEEDKIRTRVRKNKLSKIKKPLD